MPRIHMLLQLPRLKDPKIRMRYVSSTHDVDAKELLGTLPNWYVDHLREKGILKNEFGKAWRDYYTLKPGGKLEIFKVDEPGVVASLWVTIAAKDHRFLRNIVIRAYWDGESEPSVD